MLNEAVIGEVYATLPELLPRLVENLATEGQAYVDSIVAGGEAEDWDAVNHAAHPLKSMARHLGAENLADLAETIEEDPEAAPDLTNALRKSFQEALRDANAYVNRVTA